MHIYPFSRLPEKWPLAWLWSCNDCHIGQDHTTGNLTEEEALEARRYSHHELTLLVLLGALAVYSKMQSEYPAAVERAEWAAKRDPLALVAARRAIKWRKVGGAVAHYVNALKLRPMPPWVREALWRVN